MSNFLAELTGDPTEPNTKPLPKDQRDDGALFQGTRAEATAYADYYTQQREADFRSMVYSATHPPAWGEENKSFWETGFGSFLQSNPAIAYAKAVNTEILAPTPGAEGEPDKPPDWGARVMAGLVTWGAGSELTYHTPVGGYTGAQAVSKSFETNQNQTQAMSSWFQYLWDPQGAFERNLAAAQAQGRTGSDMHLAAQYTNPGYWGMNKEQAAEFAMAPRGYVGWEEPWFNNMMLPNANAGAAVTNQADIIRYQAEWILNRADDVSQIAGQAKFFSDIATGDIDYSNNPIVTQLLGEVGFPTPQEQAGHRTRIPTRGYSYTELAYGGDQYARAQEYDNQLMAQQAYHQRVGTAEEPHYYKFDSQTTQALIQSGFSQELIASFADPEKYADLYGTPDFFAVVAGVRTIDAQKRMMGLNQLQDQSIPLLNQMAFDVALGTDTVLGLLGDTFGFSGKAVRMGKQLGIFQEASQATPEIIAARKAAGVVGDALNGPITADEAAKRMQDAAESGVLPSSWQFGSNILNRAGNVARAAKNAAGTAFGIGMAGFGGYSLWTQAFGDDRSMGPVDRVTAMAAGGAFAAMGAGSMAGIGLKAVGSIAEWISPPDSTMLPNPAANTVPALANTEANRTFNNLNILWNKGANEETAGYRNFIHSSAQAWDSILNDTRPKYIIDIETTLKSQDIFQIALRPLGGGDVLELLIKPPTEGGGALESSKEAYQRAMQYGMSMEDAMARLNQELGSSSMLIGQNISGFDLPQLIKAGLTGDHLAVDTLAMALQANVSAPKEGQPAGSRTLGDLFQFFTGQPLAGAHDARADIEATATVFERLIPMVSSNLAAELKRVDDLDLPERTLSELNTRAIPSSVNEMLKRRDATYRIEDQSRAVYDAFPGMSEAQIIDRVQRGRFSTYEQYLSIYGHADGAASLEAITKQETDFYRQYGMEFRDAQKVYDYRAEQAIQNRIRIAAPNYSQQEIEASYNYLLSQYPGYDKSFIERALPALPSKRDSSSAPFWADLLSHSNYEEGQAAGVARPSVAALTPPDFIRSLMGGLGIDQSITPESLTDLVFAASGVTDRSIEIRNASEEQRRGFMSWLQQNPEADIRGGWTADEWNTYGDTQVSQLPGYMADRLLGTRDVSSFNRELEQRVRDYNRDAIADGRPQDVKEFKPYATYEEAIEAESGRVWDNHGGDVSKRLAAQYRIAGPAAMPGTETSIINALRSSMMNEYAENMFGGGRQAIDALDTALNIAGENNINLPETTKWAYQTAAELLRTSTEESTQMLRIPLDPSNPDYTSDILTKLLALNEMGEQTGMRVDLRGMRNKPVVDPASGQASYMLEVPVSEVSEWNPLYSYRNRPEDLTTASLAIDLAMQEQAMGTAGRQLGLSTEQEVRGAAGQAPGQPQHPYANYTNQQRQAAAITDTEHAMTEVLLKIASGQGDRGLTGGYRNLRVASGHSPTTWNELAAAYAQNRIVEKVGLSSTFDTTQNYGMVMDTGQYITNAAENAGMGIAIGNDGRVTITGARQSTADTDPNGAPVSILYQLFEDRVSGTLQLGNAVAGNPFVVDPSKLAPGMQVTTKLNGSQRTGNIVSRLTNGNYNIAFEQPAANEYPDAPYSSGADFLDGRYDGNPTTILSRNVSPENIIGTSVTGAGSLNIPLQRSANIAERLADNTAAGRDINYQAEEFLLSLFSKNPAGQPMVARNISDYDPQVLQRADKLMEETRGQFGGGQSINYYIDWQSAQGNQITIRPGAPELVNGKVDPYNQSSFRSASFMLEQELSATESLPPSATTMQRQDILISLLAAAEDPQRAGLTQAYSLQTPRQAQQAYVQLQEEAAAQNMAVILGGIGKDGTIQYQLQPRRENAPLINQGAFDFIGQQTHLFMNAAQQQGGALAGSLVNRMQEQITHWTTPQPEGMAYADAIAAQQPGWQNQPSTELSAQDMREAIDLRRYNNLPLDPDMTDFLAREAAAEVQRTNLAQKIAAQQTLNPAELSMAQDMGLLEGKVFLRMYDNNTQVTANGVIFGDQGASAGDQVINNDPNNTQFTQNWIGNAGLRFYTDVNEAMGITEPSTASVSNEKVTYRDASGNIIKAPKKPSEFAPTAPKRDPYTQEEVMTLEQSIAQWEQQTAAFNEWRSTVKKIHDNIGTGDTSAGTVTYEGERLRQQHITATGYVPDQGIPATELESIIAADAADLDTHPGNALNTVNEAAWLKDPNDVYNGVTDEGEYAYGSPYREALENRTSIATAAEFQRAPQSFPVLVLDADVARQTVEANRLTWPEGELPSSFVAGMNAQAQAETRAGFIKPINVNFGTEGENAAFIAGRAPDYTKMYNAPETLRNLGRQTGEGATAHSADVAVTFFETIQKPQYWVQNHEGEWVQATKKTRVLSGGVFDPANPDATPQYATPSQYQNSWTPAEQGAEGARQIWRTTKPGVSEPSVMIGAWRYGDAATNTPPVFSPAINLIDWYNHTAAISEGDFTPKDTEQARILREALANRGATPDSDIQLLLAKQRRELDSANQNGEWSIRASNIPASYTGPIPTYEDMRALTYGGGEIKTVSQKLTERSTIARATQQAGEMMNLRDIEDFEAQAAEAPEMIALAENDALNATIEMTAYQTSLYPTLMEQASGLIGQTMIHNGRTVTVTGVVPPQSYSTALERTNIPTWMGKQNTVIPGATNARSAPMNMSVGETSAISVNVRDADGNEYVVGTGDLIASTIPSRPTQGTIPNTPLNQMRKYNSNLMGQMDELIDGAFIEFEQRAGNLVAGFGASLRGLIDPANAPDPTIGLPSTVERARQRLLDSGMDPQMVDRVMPLQQQAAPTAQQAQQAAEPATMASALTAPVSAATTPAAMDNAAPPEQSPRATSFTTQLGSTYQIDPTGRTVRTKQSPGRGQGTTYEAHPVLFVTADDSISILSDFNINSDMSVQLGYTEDGMFYQVADTANFPQDKNPVTAVLDRANNSIVGMYDAKLTPEIGYAPIEKLYMPSGQSSTHIGNPIVDILYDQTPVQAATTPASASGSGGAGTPPPPVAQASPVLPDPNQGQPGTSSTGAAAQPTGTIAASLTAPATPASAAANAPVHGIPAAAAARARVNAASGTGPQTDTSYAMVRQGDERARFVVLGDEVEDPISGEKTRTAWTRPTPAEMAAQNPPVRMRPGQKPDWDTIQVTPDEIITQWYKGQSPETTATEIARESMGSPFRPKGAAAINQALNPFATTLTSQAVNFRDVMDPIGSIITSATDDPDNYITIMRALAQDPSSLLTGIPGDMLRGMGDQLDENDMFRLGPGIADQKLRSAMPILKAGSDTMFAMADYMQMRVDRAAKEGGTYSPAQWKSDYNDMMLQMGISAYGADEKAVTTAAAQRAAGIQRGLLAEAMLNLNMGAWVNNMFGGHATALAEGADIGGSVAQAAARMNDKYNAGETTTATRVYPTERTDGSIRGLTEVGTGGAVGLSQTSYYTAHKWANELTGYPMADEKGELAGYTEGGILSFLSDERKTQIQNTARRLDMMLPGSHRVLDENGQPKMDAVGNYIYTNPLADWSLAGAQQWTTNKEVAGAAVGEGAMWTRLVNNAEVNYYQQNAATAYADVFGRMANDTSLGLSEETVASMRAYAVEHTSDKSRAVMASELTDMSLAGGATTKQTRKYVSEILGINDSLTTRALDYAADTAGKVLLEPTHMTNIDSWLGNVFAFSYFGTRTAFNWAERTIRNPIAFGLVANFAQAARIEDEREAGTPARYKQSLALWGGGPELPNIIAQATGIVRMMGNQYAQQDWEEAETPIDYLKAAASFVGLNPLPLYALLTGEDPVEVAKSVIPQGRNMANAAMAAGMPVGTNDPYNRYRAARWIGAQATAGVFDDSLALMAQQWLYDEQWETGADRDFPDEVKQIVNTSFIAVGQEAFFTSAANSVTGFGVKPPPNQNELYAGALSENLQTIRGIDGRIANTIADLIPGIEAWYARSSIYPDQPNDQQPMYQPLERMNMWLPQIPRIEPPKGWRLPAWDTVTGKTMTADKNESAFYDEQTANTAIYFLLDPRTNEPFYVGQSNQPSGRYLQHIEDVNSDDVFSHPKKLQTAEMIQDGVYPKMTTIAWRAGDPKATDDAADREEQAWIGYFYYKLGKTANVTVPNYEDWQAILAEEGITIEELDAEFEKAKQGTLPQQENVRLTSTPNIKESPFYGPVPEGALGSKANLWYPDQETWDWANAPQNQASARPINGEDWAANQWGLEGVGDAKRKQLWEAGFMSWEDIANASPEEKDALLNIGTPAQVDSWMAKAQYTVGATKGLFDVQPQPPTQEQLLDEYPSTAETLYALSNVAPVSARVSATTASATIGASSYSMYQPQIDNAPTPIAPPQGAIGTSIGPAWLNAPASPTQAGASIIQSMLPNAPTSTAATDSYSVYQPQINSRDAAKQNVSSAAAGIGASVATASQNFFAALTAQTQNLTIPTAAQAATPSTPISTVGTPAQAASAVQAMQSAGPQNPMAVLAMLGIGAINSFGAGNIRAPGAVGAMGMSWLNLAKPAADIASRLSAGNFMVGVQPKGTGGGGPIRRRGVPEEAPNIPQVTQYMYLPGYRPSAQPGQQFWLPQLPGGQQFWVGSDMVASGDEYRDADWLNNPQYDPNNPEGSLRRMEEVYGPLQPVPLQLLRGQGAYINDGRGDGDRTSYMQPRTILTGARALGANPYGVGGDAGMMQTQGAPDPRTQPELYAAWQEKVMEPRGEYGIWMESPLGKAPTFDYEQTGTGLTWKTKERTPVTVTAPGMVIAVEDNPQYGKIVIVQHDFGQTIYSGLSGTGVTPGTYLATGDLIGLSGKDFSLGMQIAGQEGYVDPTPYMPSTGERGASKWALTDIPGVSAADAALLVDMGFRTPEDLRDRGTAAGIDQHPVFGAEFDAREGWSIMSAVNALLDSGENPNPPKENTEAWSTAVYASADGTEITGAAATTTGTATGNTRATGTATGGSTPAAGNVTASTPAGTQEPGEFPLTAGMVAHLTEGRIANLYKNAPHLASVSALAALDPNDPAQTKALAKALGNSADASDAAEIIEDIAKFKTPSANANIGQHPYLFATDMRGPFTGTNITAAELEDIATKGKARTFGELAATDPAKLAADAGISLQQAKNAVAVAGRYAPDAEPNSRTAPRTYTEMEAPPASGPQLTEGLFPGLTQGRIDALAEANITTLGQLTMIGKPAAPIVEGGPRVNWTPDWVRANTDAEISNADIKMLAERGGQYAADIATEGPAAGSTRLTAGLFDGLTANNVAELKQANITTLEQLRQIGQADEEGNVQWSSQWVSTQSGNDITPERVEVLAEAAGAYTAPDLQTSIMSQRNTLGLEFKPALAMAQNGIYNLEDLARTDSHWLRDNISGVGQKTAFDAITMARNLTGMRMATEAEQLLYKTGGVPVPPNIILGTDPSRTETRYPFRYEQPGTGIKGISAEKEAILYATAPSKKLAGSGDVIDTAAEFANADPDWIYEASKFKWSMDSINETQNLMRTRLGQATQTLGGSRYAVAAQQDLTTLGLTEEQVTALKKLDIYDYGRLIASEHSNATIASALGYNEDKVAALRESAATQMQAIKAKLDAEQKGEPESAQPSTPLAKQLTEPADATAQAPDFSQTATFLGMSEEEVAALTAEERFTKVNDRMSLYNQRQGGGGESDRKIAQFTQRYDMGSANIDAVAEKTAGITDRRGSVAVTSPMPSRGTPQISNRTTGIDMKQIASMVQRMIGDLEPKMASNFYRQLERSLYA